MTARDRQRRRHARRKDPIRVVLVFGGAVLGAIALVLVAGVAYVAAIANKVPPLSQLKVTTAGLASTVYAADGSVIGQIPATILRQPVSRAHMPERVRQATVAIEDHGFFQHGAIDYVSLIRAALTDVTSGATVQGGSTITMQLVRNLYPLVGDEKTFSRKIKEAVVAERFEKAHTKQWILTDYLNTVPYGTVGGQTAEGVQAASLMFFDHPAVDDSLAQSALLAGLPQAPTDYNPFYHPQAALARRNQVLSAMAKYGYISAAVAAATEAKPLELVPNTYYEGYRDDAFADDSYFVSFVRQELLNRYGPNVLASGDLKIYTTIDPHLSNLATAAINGVLDDPGDPSAALVSENPANGYVDAIGQSGSFSQSQYNLATQAERQPGSTFKAIVLADALAHGIDPFTTEYLSHTLEPGWLASVPTYTVSIDGGGDLDSPLNLDQALVASDNTVFAQLAADLGEPSVTAMAYAMGVVPGTLHNYPAEALGGLTVGVTPLEMANVYSTIADGGWRNKQITITKVAFPDGRVDRSWGVPHRVKVLSTAAMDVETEILQHNVEYGTATESAIGCPTAAKTGTTSGLVDAWLDGFTPDRATVVWMGYEAKNISMDDVHGQAQYGGDLPAQIWHDFMSQVVTPPCVPLPNPLDDPMTYVPFSGHYQQLGLASYVPPAPPAPPAPPSKKKSNGGAKAPTGTNQPATQTPGTTAPATTNPGGAAAPPGGGGGAGLGAPGR